MTHPKSLHLIITAAALSAVAVGAGIMLSLIVLAVMATASPAHAEDWQNAFFGHSSAYRNPDEHHRHRRHIPRREPQVRSWVHVEPVERWSERDNCKPRITVVGARADLTQ